jgi:hypothetical protein
MTILSSLLLVPVGGDRSASSKMEDPRSAVLYLNRDEFDNLLTLADSNHVIVRGLEAMLRMTRDIRDDVRSEWAEAALDAEHARINTAVAFLQNICAAFEGEGYGVTVIKSLDHWPDLGSDLDLYTDTQPEDVFRLMTKHFHAEMASRSWGDRLAGKWNFLIPGLLEAVEIHMGRLGQTGEQVAIASHLAKRSRMVWVGDRAFRVPSASDRLIISVLQRMYRHFYFRLCDVVDSAALVEAGGVDYEDLQSAASSAGIWEGVASYLAIVSDYVRQYRGSGLDLPAFVMASARFGGDDVRYGNGFLRVPILPQSAKLYGTQLAGLVRKHELINSARLSLLPLLATAALVGQKITGSDKGIW